MKVLIIIPSYNEEENIENVVNNIINNFPQYDYCIVNDCSTDKTLEICRKRNYNFVSLCTNLGIGGGVQTGYMYAVENDYDVTVQIDGDGQHDPQYIAEMIEVMQQNEADMVIGSRFLEKEGFQTSFARRIGIKIINTLIRICGKVKVTDSTSGFRVCSKRMTQYFSLHYAQDYPEPEAIVSASLRGFKVMEHPVKMHERTGGVSSINLPRSVYYMFKVSFALIIQRLSVIGGKRNGF